MTNQQDNLMADSAPSTISSIKYSYSYGATLVIHGDVKGVFRLSEGHEFKNIEQVHEFTKGINKQTGLLCRPTIKRSHNNGSFEAIILKAIFVTPNGKAEEAKPEFWHIPVMYMSKKDYDAMSTSEQFDFMRTHKADFFYGV